MADAAARLIATVRQVFHSPDSGSALSATGT